jgi:sugar lactone lactonase YvrE
VGPDGSIYFGESFAFAIRKITPEGMLTTVAGNGSVGQSGDDGPALAAQIGTDIAGIAVDLQGNVYFADTNATVRKVDPHGTITRFAGTGERGFSGDGGPASAAQLGAINDIKIDRLGQLYIATVDNRVRRVNLDRTIQTVAGNGQSSHAGDGGPATQASLAGVVAIAVDVGGALFIGETSYQIRRVAADGTITTVAGNGRFGYAGENVNAPSATLGGLNAMDAGLDGSLYFTEQSQNTTTTPFSRLRKLTPDGKLMTVAAGHGVGYPVDGTLATEARAGQIFGVAIDGSGTLYLTDIREHLVEKVDAFGILTIVAGVLRFAGDGRPAAQAVMNLPTGIAADSAGNVYVGEGGGLRIRKIDSKLTVSTYAGNGEFGDYGDGLPADAASFGWPNQMAFLPDDSLLVADFANNRVRRIDHSGIITTIAGNGQPGSSGDGGAAVVAQLNNPFGVAVDPSGSVYISEATGHRIRKLTADGRITTIAGTGTRGFSGDGGPASQAQLANPRSLALDAKGNLYVADFNNNRIRRISPDGTITTVAGNGRLGWTGDGEPATEASIYSPFGLVVDSFGAVIFTGAAPPGRGGTVRRLKPDGTIDTLAGSSTAGMAGFGDDAADVRFNFPDSLAVDPVGRILVTDRYNQRVLALIPAE